MRTVYIIIALLSLVVYADPAHAKNWRRVRGTLVLTSYSDNSGATLSDIPPSSRYLVINTDLRRRSTVRGIRTSCKTVRRIKQRICVSTYYYPIAGQGSCLIGTRTTMFNFASSSRNIYTYAEGVMRCPTGFSSYLTAEGELRRS